MGEQVDPAKFEMEQSAEQLFSISFPVESYNFGGKSTEFIADLVVGCGNLYIEVKFVEILPPFVQTTKGPKQPLRPQKQREKICQPPEKVLENSISCVAKGDLLYGYQ